MCVCLFAVLLLAVTIDGYTSEFSDTSEFLEFRSIPRILRNLCPESHSGAYSGTFSLQHLLIGCIPCQKERERERATLSDHSLPHLVIHASVLSS